MSKQTKATEPTEPTSIRDAGYQVAKTGDSMRGIARYVFGQCPTILDTMPDNVKTELREGFQLRKHEITPAQAYKMGDGGTYIPLKPEQVKAGEAGVVEITINSAMSYSSQEFGRLRQADPAKYAVVKPMRDSYSNYASNKMADLLREIRFISQEGQPRARAVNKDWDEAVKTAFDALEKRAKTLKARGDARADPLKFSLARAAFLKSYDA